MSVWFTHIYERIKNQTEPIGQCRSDKIQLTGADLLDDESYYKKMDQAGIDQDNACDLYGKYGANALKVADKFSSLAVSYDVEQALLIAQLEYCIDCEMVTELSDFLIRRTGSAYFNRATGLRNIGLLNDHVALKFGWSDDQKNASLARCKQEFSRVVDFH